MSEAPAAAADQPPTVLRGPQDHAAARGDRVDPGRPAGRDGGTVCIYTYVLVYMYIYVPR